ncbi:MAG: SPOR domain-containing protein [Rhodospirillales bacterium]|nr:SPOR domain-containing protein [Rhodospirillales bacterium]
MIGLLVLGGLVYGGWQGYQFLQGTPSVSGEMPYFTANNSPYKQVPDDPGGAEIEHTDVAILIETFGGEAEGEKLEVLMPEPERPMALKDTADDSDIIDVEVSGVAETITTVGTDPFYSPDAVTTLVDQVMTDVANAVPGGLPIPTEKPEPPEAPAVTIAAVDETTVSLAAGADNAGLTDDAGLTFEDVVSAVEGTSRATTGTVATNTGEPALDGAAVPRGDGLTRVQIAAYSSRDIATAAWDRLYLNNNDLLADVDALIIEAVIGEATFYRLQVGAYDSRAGAETLCSDLRQRDIDCLVVGP